ncbi:MAG: carbamoyltransferase HypF [Cytophagaceae bacterium]|nr:carbamoyltransferase HypF [Cytophagaceae bacterium]
MATEQIAPGLAKLGVMLPNSPLLQLISDNFGKPLVATSANLSGSPIVYLDEEALKYLGEFADFIITYDREIVAPQDDSVEQITESGQRIILRRSRGFAPNYYPLTFSLPKTPTLAMGADMKAAFGVNTGKNLFISQYLGDQSSFDSQQSYDTTLNHISNLMDFVPKTIISDLHPEYFTSQKAEELKIKYNSELIQTQHHKAHFLSVLAENNLLDLKDKTLGVIWDGVGYGEDGKIWGGEFFTFQNKKIERVAHWEYFHQLLGDKMSKEPRISALSLLKKSKHKEILRPYFSEKEWVFYENLVETSPEIQTSSMGRMMDGLACILGLKAINTYESEAAMLLENLAAKNPNKTSDFYTFELKGAIINNVSIFENIIEDIQNKMPIAEIAEKFFNTLVKSIERISVENQTRRIAFSGGVMQNAFFVDKIIENLGKQFDLYFHQQLSPNDENIALGQLAFHYLEEEILGVGNLEKNIKIG